MLNTLVDGLQNPKMQSALHVLHICLKNKTCNKTMETPQFYSDHDDPRKVLKKTKVWHIFVLTNESIR